MSSFMLISSSSYQDNRAFRLKYETLNTCIYWAIYFSVVKLLDVEKLFYPGIFLKSIQIYLCMSSFLQSFTSLLIY